MFIERKTANKAVDTTRAKRPELWMQQGRINPTSLSAGLLALAYHFDVRSKKMNTISPSDFPSPWDVITYVLMAAYLFYAAMRWTKKGFVDWTFRLGDRNIGLKMKEGRISRKNSPYLFWSIQVLLTLAFSFCLTSAVLKEGQSWILILSYVITSLAFMLFLISTAIRIDHNDA